VVHVETVLAVEAPDRRESGWFAGAHVRSKLGQQRLKAGWTPWVARDVEDASETLVNIEPHNQQPEPQRQL
jgi:hypothetical protein